MKFRNWIIIIVVISMIFTIQFCSGGNTNNSDDNTTNQEQDSNENQTNTTNNNVNVNEDENQDENQDMDNLDYNISNDSSTEKEIVQLLEGLNEDGIIENYKLHIENLTEDLRYYKVNIIEYENIDLIDEVYTFSIDTNEIYEIDFPVIDIKLPSMIKYEWKASLSKDNLDE